jgi:hypothetical protein
MTTTLKRWTSSLAMAALAVASVGVIARAQSDGGSDDDGGVDAGLDAGLDAGVDGGADGGALAGTLLDFHVMAPVTAPFVGSSNPIRGVNGGGEPWTIGHGDGTLRADGQLEINVAGLVLANDPSVPQGQAGTNPSSTFLAIVSCQSVDSSGAPKEVNVKTDPVPATPTGDARFQTTVALPKPCLAPVVFVANGSSGAWFAVTGAATPGTR